MRIIVAKNLASLGSLIFLAFIGSGCGLFPDVTPKSKSNSSGSDTIKTSPSLQTRPASRESSKNHPSEWLLKPGLFKIEQGLWLGWIGLAFGLLGTGLSIHCSRNSNRLNKKLIDKQIKISRLDKEIHSACYDINQLTKRVDDSSTKLTHLHLSYQHLEEKFSSVLLSLNSQRLQQKPEQDPLAYRLTSSVENPSLTSQKYIQSPRQKLDAITKAVNLGERQVCRAEMRAQLNITNESENAISMGRLNETHLEEVTAGGSYWIASIGGETWLYPTEQTLKGYSQSQRPTGIFNYIRQSIPSALVLTPARLALNGSLWSVVDQGSIAVPG